MLQGIARLAVIIVSSRPFWGDSCYPPLSPGSPQLRSTVELALLLLKTTCGVLQEQTFRTVGCEGDPDICTPVASRLGGGQHPMSEYQSLPSRLPGEPGPGMHKVCSAADHP